MANNLSPKANFEDVKRDEEALQFHAERFANGKLYPLGKACYTYIQLKKIRTPFQVYEDSEKENNV
jgi:hypothetical protein